MLSNYSNTFFPLCSFIVSLFLLILFNYKKNVKNQETKIYSNLVLCGFFESLTYVSLTYVVDFFFFDLPEIFFIIYNKLLVCLYITWVTLLYYYIINITRKTEEIINKKTHNLLIVVAAICCLITLVLPIDLYYDPIKYISNAEGAAIDFLYAVCSIYIVLMIRIVIKNRKNENLKDKFIPFYLLFVLLTISMIVRLIDPFFNITSNVFSLVLLVMYHTIENPDVKMLEQLEYAKGQAEKANLAKSDFLSSMSHEIRTPLNAIVGFSECILEENDLEAAKEDAKDIVIASQNLLEIVNGILDISKIEADKMEIVEINYNPRENFENLAKLMVPRIGDKPIILNTKLPEDLPGTLFGDCGKVKQIVTNILTNAVKYTEKGEINFEVNCINTNNECSLVISVEDTGRGIKPDKIESLFAKFERLEEDRNTTTEGTGLGLAITKKLTEMLGGTIVVQSKYGEGSKFTVYLKQQIVSLNEDVTKEKETNDNVTIDYSSKKVLIVDDNNINIKVAERLLREYKLNIESVISGFECLDKIKLGNKYDLILLDDMMPKMSGVETLQELKKINGFNIPTIALTANALSGMREKYLESGFNDYLSKPIEKLELKRVLETYLSDDNSIVINNAEIKKETTIETLETKENIESNKNNDDILVQNGIDINKGLELLGDIELYNETFNDFINTIPERLEKLEEYKNSNDMPNYAILAHATKSDSKYLGCTKLAEIALNHELKSKENNSEYVNNNYDEFISEINKVVEAGKSYLNKDE